MIYSIILSAGKGERLRYANEYKQYIKLEGKPIFIHTLEKFILNLNFDQHILVTNVDYLLYTQNILKKYQIPTDKISIIEGGSTRHQSLFNATKYIKEKWGLKSDDIAISHDSVRPFVSSRIIEDNIRYASIHSAVDTVIHAQDTIALSTDQEFIQDIPKREYMYQGQTPQSFNIEKFYNLSLSLPNDVITTLTDAIKIFIHAKEKVKLVWGDKWNIKITDTFDLTIAQYLISPTHKNKLKDLYDI